MGERYGASYAGAFPAMTGRRLRAHAGMAAIRAYEMALFGRLLDGLETIPGARLAIIPGAGHSPQFESSDVWLAELLDFLDSVTSAARREARTA